MSVQQTNMNAVRKLRNAARLIRALPALMGQFYANIAAGNMNPVVGDRFQGKGNGRFVPLSTDYALWKQGHSKSLNTKQHDTYGRGSKPITVEHKRRTQGVDLHGFAKGSMPILVRTGRLRALVAYSGGHQITLSGDTAIVSFVNLPPYAKYLHTGTSKMPKRSPVEPNADDIKRVRDFAERRLSAYIGAGSAVATFGSGLARIT